MIMMQLGCTIMVAMPIKTRGYGHSQWNQKILGSFWRSVQTMMIDYCEFSCPTLWLTDACVTHLTVCVYRSLLGSLIITVYLCTCRWSPGLDEWCCEPCPQLEVDIPHPGDSRPGHDPSSHHGRLWTEDRQAQEEGEDEGKTSLHHFGKKLVCRSFLVLVALAPSR